MTPGTLTIADFEKAMKYTPPFSDGPTLNVNPLGDMDLDAESGRTLWNRLGLALTQNQQPIVNLDNVTRVLEKTEQFKGMVWFDEFHQKYFTTFGSQGIHEWSNVDDLEFTRTLQRTFRISRVSDDLANKAIRLFARKDVRNEPRDWMGSFTWDGKARIDTFFIDCSQAPDNEYTRAASRNFWVSLAARTFKPGAKVDNMIILEGRQGNFKSTLFATIGGSWHSEASESVNTKDFYQTLTGKLIVEFAELSSFPRAEVAKIKQILSNASDRYRTPYDRVAEDHPRRSVFVGSTNEATYLKDDTGARRFWPIKTGTINIARVKADREQLFAEAVHLFKAGATWWEMPEMAADEQEERRQVDPWEDKILGFIESKSMVTTGEIFDLCLNIDPGKRTRFDEMRVGNILRLFGWEKKRKRYGSALKWVYEPVNTPTWEE